MRIPRIAFPVVLFASLTSCSLCAEQEWTFHLSGTVEYPEYASGAIQFIATGDDWMGCDGSGQTPGKRIGETTIAAPGPFAFDVHISSNTHSPPRILLAAYALGTATEIWHCEAGASTTFPAEDRSGIALTLQVGLCPAWM